LLAIWVVVIWGASYFNHSVHTSTVAGWPEPCSTRAKPSSMRSRAIGGKSPPSDSRSSDRFVDASRRGLLPPRGLRGSNPQRVCRRRHLRGVAMASASGVMVTSTQ
jgi:hypothetical protein